MNMLGRVFATVGGLLLLSGAAQAAPLLPGAQINPALPQGFGGSELATRGGDIVSPTFSASYTSSVYSDPNNIFGSGLLDFVYQFRNVTGDAIERMTVSNFASFLTNAGFSGEGDSDAPSVIDRSGSGAVIGFDFGGFSNVAPGHTSAFLIVQTNASGFTFGDLSLQDGTAGGGVGFAPSTVSSAPEPASWLLLLGGVGALGGLLRAANFRGRGKVGAEA